MKYSVSLRNARLDAIRNAIGPSPTLAIYSGRMPSPDHPVEKRHALARLKLPDTWMADAQNGEASSPGQWRGKAFGDGEAKFFRIEGRSGVIQGSVPEELTLSPGPHIAPNIDVIVEKFTLRAGNG